MTFPEFVKEKKNEGKTQVQIAKDIGLTPGQLTNILKGRRSLTTDQALFVEQYSGSKVSFRECFLSKDKTVGATIPAPETLGTPFESHKERINILRETGHAEVN